MPPIQIKQIVIWGHKLHSHTHSYIHNGFHVAFKHLGYSTYWFDDSDDVSSVDFSNTLFITEHQVNKKIPLRNDCLYFTHYIDEGDYAGISLDNIVLLKVSQRDFLECDKDKNYLYLPLDYNDVPNEFYAECDGIKAFYTYWATDLLPHQIQHNIDNLHTDVIEPYRINFVGSMTKVWYNLDYVSRENNIDFRFFGASFDQNSTRNKSIEENMRLIQESIIAPALQDDYQVSMKYIPCRIFKNISYGKMGITNNWFVNSLFDNKLIFHNDAIKSCSDGIYFEKFTDKDEKKYRINELMEIVRDKHTYVNRINSIRIYIKNFTEFVLPDLIS
jgi:hypothetical protein